MTDLEGMIHFHNDAGLQQSEGTSAWEIQRRAQFQAASVILQVCCKFGTAGKAMNQANNGGSSKSRANVGSSFCER